MTTPGDPQAKVYSHINGGEGEILARLAVAELCKGWPIYRDASEWKNFRSLFSDDACVWTTWSKRQPIDNFIEKSKEGKSNGDFILHRECGTLVELNTSTLRAVGKMKATITQRFNIGEGGDAALKPVVFDVDCDSRFHFFCFYDSNTNAWKVKYVKLIYEKDKLVPVDGNAAPGFPRDALDRYPEGYKYLGAAQNILGHDIDASLPTIQVPEYGSSEALRLELYEKMEEWLDGADDIDLSTSDSISYGHKATNGKDTHKQR
ncbi:hypothetical protein Daesc_008147 [Daldinia eschscholtzii]|uniref:SnoaL-like domain-containing protein n=1 Tax=Daldinia eschscholtzii TaxID=292717 RepID=A0AAX6MBM9_9PEZI